MEKIDPNGNVVIPVSHHPLFKTEIAIQRGVERKLLFRTWGGLGDQICAEPTIRHALKMFKDCDIYIAAELPELFKHLPVKKIFDLKEGTPLYDKYLVFDTITPPDDSNMVWLFFSHLLTHCVDFPSMCALRTQLPNAEKEIILKPDLPDFRKFGIDMESLFSEPVVLVHPGKHWPSKTFPKKFWDAVLSDLRERGIRPVIIGADTDDNRGTVEVNTEGCIDLRNKLSVMESVWVCQKARVLLTNDSSPLHMAASGDAYIGFVATCKHPDFITHWRNGEFGWRMKNFGLGGIWDVIDYCPNRPQKITVEEVNPELLKSWLPAPEDMAEWAAGCCYEET